MTKNNPTSRKTRLYQKIPLILFGLLLTAVILEIILRISGFIILSMQERRNLQSIQEKGLYRIMCLGESTTQHQYPTYLEEILNQRNIGIKFRVIDKGQAGVNTALILSQLEANLDTYHPDMVVTMMGCNDDAGVMYYKDIPEANTGIFQHCRLYRFGRIIYMHISNKLKEKRDYGLNNIVLDKKLKLKNIDSLSDNKNDESECVYQSHDEFLEKEDIVRKDKELNPKNNPAYLALGQHYGYQGRFTESVQVYKRAIELNPKNDSAYLELGWLYGGHRRFIESEQAFKKAIELNPQNGSAYRGLSAIYCEMGNNEVSKMYIEKTNSIREEHYNLVPCNNYRLLKQILDKRKIKLVCVQYPVCSIAPLKKIFKGQEGVIFVDNEKIFKDAIRKQGYKECFVDMFAGGFGHCTQTGNRLLAENISNVILKEVFHKNSLAYAGLGDAYTQNHDPETAIEYYNKAIALDPKNISAYLGLGNAYTHNHDPKTAIEYFNKAIALNPKNVSAYVGLANAYTQKNDPEAAIEYYNKAIALFPNNPQTYFFMWRLYASQNDADSKLKKEEIFKKLEKLDKDLADKILSPHAK